MPLSNPVAANNFHVFLMDAAPLDTSASGLGKAAATVAVGATMTAVFGSFAECSGLDSELESEEYHEGGHNSGPRVFAKWGKYPSLVLKRGVTSSPALWDWYYQVLYGKKPLLRKNGLILLTDSGPGVAGGTGSPVPLGLPFLDKQTVAVWWFSNGLPSKLSGPSLNAKTNEIAIEGLTITHEGLYRVGAASLPGVGEAAASLGV